VRRHDGRAVGCSEDGPPDRGVGDGQVRETKRGTSVSSAGLYEGRRVIVCGGGGAGMGAAVVRQLEPLGAEIHVIDLKEPPVDVASYHSVDLKDPDAVASTLEAIGGRIDGLFNCAGLPGGRFSDLDTMLVNFVGQRHLADLVTERMEPGSAIASISSGAGAGWQGNIEKWRPLVATEGFAAGQAWLEEHPLRRSSSSGPCGGRWPWPRRASGSTAPCPGRRTRR
jgi:NAD(P)-dependent dehydrogenase (short-subunit alcohol dehydrogenase family)